ncbi:hypothetical protein METBIDRAFT_48413, partial [Metschnikowia bicuspidata var. bicuspidata NRRL YB-4993]
MTRTKKWTVHEKASTPRFFTHNGHFNTDPNKVNKNGSGKFNWGKPGDELMDESEFPSTGRRNSNHMANEQDMQ